MRLQTLFVPFSKVLLNLDGCELLLLKLQFLLFCFLCLFFSVLPIFVVNSLGIIEFLEFFKFLKEVTTAKGSVGQESNSFGLSAGVFLC